MLSQYLTQSSKKENTAYNPTKAVRELTVCHQKDYQRAEDLRHRSFREFNDMSVIQRMNLDQATFNVFEEPASEDPDESWRSTSRRPVSRNKVIGIAAHLLSSMMYPNVTAHDELDEVDAGAAEVMKSLMEWNIDNSDYDISMLFGIVASCVNPCAYMGVEYCEAFQTIRDNFEGGEISIKQVIDDVVSGLQVDPIPMSEILISNIYQYSHQRQPYRIRRRYISMEDFEAKYGDHTYAKHVKPGVQMVWSSSDQTFYEIDETERSELVEEMVISYRQKDLEVPYVQGVYMGKDNVEANRFKHRDNTGRPRYPEAKWGYEPIDEKRFYFYKSLIFKLWPDQKRIDRMYQIHDDSSLMDALPSIITHGSPGVDASVVFPASVTALPQGTTVTKLDVGRNLNNLSQNILKSEESISESSQSEVRAGGLAPGEKTRYEIAKAEQNAIIKEFAIFGRMTSSMVEQVGEFMVDNIIRFQSVSDAEEITPNLYRLKDKTFTLPNQTERGRKVTKKIVFTDEYMGKKMKKKDVLKDSYRMLEESEDTGVVLFKVNPELFAKRKYKLNIEPDAQVPRTEAFKEEKNMRAYNMLIGNPFADKEAVSRDFLFDPLTDGNSEKYMVKAQSLGLLGAPPGKPSEVVPSDKFISNLKDTEYVS